MKDFRLSLILVLLFLFAFGGCRRGSPQQQAETGDYSFGVQCHDPEFSGTIIAPVVAGFSRLEVDSVTGRTKGGGTVYPANVRLPSQVTVTLEPVDGPSKSVSIDVPTVIGHTGFLRNLYVILLPDQKLKLMSTTAGRNTVRSMLPKRKLTKAMNRRSRSFDC